MKTSTLFCLLLLTTVVTLSAQHKATAKTNPKEVLLLGTFHYQTRQWYPKFLPIRITVKTGNLNFSYAIMLIKLISPQPAIFTLKLKQKAPFSYSFNTWDTSIIFHLLSWSTICLP